MTAQPSRISINVSVIILFANNMHIDSSLNFWLFEWLLHRLVKSLVPIKPIWTNQFSILYSMCRVKIILKFLLISQLKRAKFTFGFFLSYSSIFVSKSGCKTDTKACLLFQLVKALKMLFSLILQKKFLFFLCCMGSQREIWMQSFKLLDLGNHIWDSYLRFQCVLSYLVLINGMEHAIFSWAAPWNWHIYSINTKAISISDNVICFVSLIAFIITFPRWSTFCLTF